MIDSHCHLDHDPLYSDIENIIKRSTEIGVKKILTISTTHKSFEKILDITKIMKLFMEHLVFIHTKPEIIL